MDTNKLLAFMEVCETGSYSLVAKKFGYTHSGISYMIRSLEEEFGFPLIERVDNHFEPTDKALRILPKIEMLLSAADDLKHTISEVRLSGDEMLTIGTIESVSIKWIPLAIARFHKQHPNCSTNILNGDPFEINKWLQNGTIQIGVSDITWSDTDFDRKLLTEDRFYGIFPHNTPNLDSVPMSAFENQYILIPNHYDNRSITKLLADHNIHYRQPNDRTSSMLSILSNVATGRAVSISTALMLDISSFIDLPPELRPTIVPIEPTETRKIGIIYKKHADSNSLIQDFIRCLEKTVRDYPAKRPDTQPDSDGK